MYPICIPVCLHQLGTLVKGTCGVCTSQPRDTGRQNYIEADLFLSPQLHQGWSHSALNREWVVCAVNRWMWNPKHSTLLSLPMGIWAGYEDALHSLLPNWRRKLAWPVWHTFFQALLSPFTCTGFCCSNNLISEYGFGHLKWNYTFSVYKMAFVKLLCVCICVWGTGERLDLIMGRVYHHFYGHWSIPGVIPLCPAQLL